MFSWQYIPTSIYHQCYVMSCYGMLSCLPYVVVIKLTWAKTTRNIQQSASLWHKYWSLSLYIINVPDELVRCNLHFTHAISTFPCIFQIFEHIMWKINSGVILLDTEFLYAVPEFYERTLEVMECQGHSFLLPTAVWVRQKRSFTLGYCPVTRTHIDDLV